jgi:hypothetical protein
VLDASFGNGGVTLSALGTNGDSVVTSLAAEPDDDIITVAWVVTDTLDHNATAALARYLGNSIGGN